MSSAASHTPAYAAVDLSTCDREPIHIPGAVQPHGVLVAMDEALTAVVVSANLGSMLGVEAEAALGQPLSAIIGPSAAEEVEVRVREWMPGEPHILVFDEDEVGGSMAGIEVDLTLHRSGDRTVLEIEPLGRPRSTLLSYQSARGAMARLGAADTTEGLLSQLAKEVRSLTHFDRVMVYQFDKQWNGEVVAEERRDDLNPFFGLHYPASDIPAQARRLYTVNWTRLIADVEYEPVHLVPVLDPATGAPLDMTHSTLRSVSPIHLEYLHHMGVGASMSISLVIDGELWGLVACHHYSGPHRPSQDARNAAEFLGQVASQMIAQQERAAASDNAFRAQEAVARMTARIAASQESPIERMADDPELLALVRASGAAVLHSGVLHTRGEVPDDAALRRIAADLLGEPWGEPIASDALSELDPALGLVADVAAGALGIGSGPDSWVLWLRPELPQIVDWGGDPSNKEVYAAQGDEVRISPRKSFDLWREIVRGSSQPWQDWELEAVRGLRTFMNALLLQRSREQIAVAESLQQTVLPQTTPVFAGMELEVRYDSASSYRLGGDWWDAVPLHDGRVALVVGDVAGHGVAAVGAMTQVRAALQAHLHGGVRAAESLDRLDLLVVDLLPDQVATAVVAVVDPRGHTVELSAAGHPPPMLFGADGVQLLDVPARPLLGVGAGQGDSVTVPLTPGSTLVLYTDGLIERRGEDVADGVQRLSDAGAQAPAGEPLSAFADRLLDGLPDGGDDDTTVVAVRVL